MEKTTRNLSILAALAGVLGVISAYGSTCPTLDPPTDPTSKLYIMNVLQPVFVVTTSLTWAVGFAWFFLLWAIIKLKNWFYTSAVLVSLIGALSGFIPAALVMSNGMPFSPSLMRAFLNLYIFIYLIRPNKATAIKSLIASGSQTGVTSSVIIYILIAVGILLMLQPIIVPWTHIIDGVYEYGLEALQFFGGVFSILLAGSIKLSERFSLTQIDFPVKITRLNSEQTAD